MGRAAAARMLDDLRARRDRPPLVKICGLTRPADVLAVNAARPDLCGFVIDVPRSSRNVASGDVARLSLLVDPAIVRVGVFVDADPRTVVGLVAANAIDAVQLHGHEDRAYVARLRELGACSSRCILAPRDWRADGLDATPIVQAFCVRTREDLERAAVSGADLVLLDNGAGGTGERFDWGLLGGFGRPFLLAGGLGPGNVAKAMETTGCWGVDMSSGVETDGNKDPHKICAAVEAVRAFGQGDHV